VVYQQGGHRDSQTDDNCRHSLDDGRIEYFGRELLGLGDAVVAWMNTQVQCICCPFCLDARTGVIVDDKHVVDAYVVVCIGCGARGPLGHSRQEATQLWNGTISLAISKQAYA
jgi:hypothetical protein